MSLQLALHSYDIYVLTYFISVTGGYITEGSSPMRGEIIIASSVHDMM